MNGGLIFPEEISEKYLSQIIIPLKANGLITTFRGAHGGYTLSRPASEIKLREIIEPLAVAMHAVRIGMITREDSVAIIGDGTIGLCALSVAKALGISPVFLISKHKNRGEVARALGATAVISLSDGDSAELISNFIDGPGVDKSIECAGTLDSAQLSMKITRRGGTIVLVGVFDEQSSLPLSSCCFDEKTLVGSCLYVGEFKEIISLLQNKKIDISPLITSIIPIEDALEMGFNKLLTSKEDIKVLVRVS